MKLPIQIRTEQTKLTATYLNGLAIAVFAVGGFAPLIAAGSTIHDFTMTAREARFQVNVSGASVVIALICFGLSALLHWSARRSLRSLPL